MIIIAGLCGEGVGIHEKECVRINPVAHCFADALKMNVKGK